ncbi:hypothetical protein T492DRAFT_959263 [Pavlovales sp. CCMP2436]|nr:hypothetical protein T492DRAFT_959263 [Pavlovales sp. CCMP2436]
MLYVDEIAQGLLGQSNKPTDPALMLQALKEWDSKQPEERKLRYKRCGQDDEDAFVSLDPPWLEYSAYSFAYTKRASGHYPFPDEEDGRWLEGFFARRCILCPSLFMSTEQRVRAIEEWREEHGRVLSQRRGLFVSEEFKWPEREAKPWLLHRCSSGQRKLPDLELLARVDALVELVCPPAFRRLLQDERMAVAVAWHHQTPLTDGAIYAGGPACAKSGWPLLNMSIWLRAHCSRGGRPLSNTDQRADIDDIVKIRMPKWEPRATPHFSAADKVAFIEDWDAIADQEEMLAITTDDQSECYPGFSYSAARKFVGHVQAGRVRLSDGLRERLDPVIARRVRSPLKSMAMTLDERYAAIDEWYSQQPSTDGGARLNSRGVTLVSVEHCWTESMAYAFLRSRNLLGDEQASSRLNPPDEASRGESAAVERAAKLAAVVAWDKGADASVKLKRSAGERIAFGKRVVGEGTVRAWIVGELGSSALDDAMRFILEDIKNRRINTDWLPPFDPRDEDPSVRLQTLLGFEQRDEGPLTPRTALFLPRGGTWRTPYAWLLDVKRGKTAISEDVLLGLKDFIDRNDPFKPVASDVVMLERFLAWDESAPPEARLLAYCDSKKELNSMRHWVATRRKGGEFELHDEDARQALDDIFERRSNIPALRLVRGLMEPRARMVLLESWELTKSDDAVFSTITHVPLPPGGKVWKTPYSWVQSVASVRAAPAVSRSGVTSKYKGVSVQNSKSVLYDAHARHNGTQHALLRGSSELDAALAYDKFVLQHPPVTKSINFPAEELARYTELAAEGQPRTCAADSLCKFCKIVSDRAAGIEVPCTKLPGCRKMEKHKGRCKFKE